MIIKNHLSSKFGKSLIKFFLKFQKERSAEENEINKKKVEGASSLEKLLHYSQEMLESKEASALFLLKQRMKKELKIEDLQALGSGEMLRAEVYDYFT